jgi:hypothetical protein
MSFIRKRTREGLLVPVDRHHAGTGKHRRYDADSTYDAAILNAVASAGLHVVTQKYPIEALAMARHARAKWQRTRSRGPLLLETHRRPRAAAPRSPSMKARCSATRPLNFPS